MHTSMTVDQTRQMFIHLAKEMVASKDLLTHADQAVGDGDHGIGIARGFEAVQAKLETQKFETIDDILKTIGFTLINTIGGAAGAVFGTFFAGGAKNLPKRDTLDSTLLSQLLIDGMAAVQQRGKAKPGDKTMLDTLFPAAEASKLHLDAPLAESLAAVAEAAKAGMEKTKDMIATVGKAKALGERSRGHIDPGAITTYLMLKCMSEYQELNNE
ncbi:MAG: dihydroxyacetone kinase subunit L [Planctomycetes bacterium]|nr:dihydroxyacetone kinase subunit L [Planctomycetota bacterium]